MIWPSSFCQDRVIPRQSRCDPRSSESRPRPRRRLEGPSGLRGIPQRPLLPWPGGTIESGGTCPSSLRGLPGRRELSRVRLRIQPTFRYLGRHHRGRAQVPSSQVACCPTSQRLAASGTRER
jgi:hypothetical protein